MTDPTPNPQEQAHPTSEERNLDETQAASSPETTGSKNPQREFQQLDPDLNLIKEKILEDIARKIAENYSEHLSEQKLRDFFLDKNDHAFEDLKALLEDKKYQELIQPKNVIQRLKSRLEWLEDFKTIFPTAIVVGLCAGIFGVYSNYKADLRERKTTNELNNQRILEGYMNTIKEIELSRDYSEESKKERESFIQNLTVVTLRELTEGNDRKARLVLFLHQLGIPEKNPNDPCDISNSASHPDQCQFYKGGNLKFVHFTGYNLNNINLSYADLRGASFLNTQLLEAKLIGSDLKCEMLQEADILSEFPILELFRVFNLNQTAKQKCTDLRGAKLMGADLRGAELIGANLSGADLSVTASDKSSGNILIEKGANLTMTDLTGANLTGVNLSYATLKGALLNDAYLEITQCPKPNCLNLAFANLSNAYLNRANLTNANLTDAYLNRANLTNANLTGANLTRAELRGANLTGANLTDANLAGANLTGADLTGADLTSADLTGANLKSYDNLIDDLEESIDKYLDNPKNHSLSFNQETIDKVNQDVNFKQELEELRERVKQFDNSKNPLEAQKMAVEQFKKNIQKYRNRRIPKTDLTNATLIGTNLTDVTLDEVPQAKDAKFINNPGISDKLEQQLLNGGARKGYF
ncbi:pentapeptide repeat-containing protein [Roseofilum sp. BLCC_M154]|uniref:Pentapeptide repeat-containing protein n=1 Tax=Roseofilum acuticapitatum BLCC-M154 TaxID=3022444 RepID=A0ABT7APJ1_9CYAN|nr:pentapeptide repeat-containing protein [Roseofilum acuticapitatum]MDJ1168813.1 pentapeptide repeat-containing protein [Roseofilum acuticapitatum BLCC-M154]